MIHNTCNQVSIEVCREKQYPTNAIYSSTAKNNWIHIFGSVTKTASKGSLDLLNELLAENTSTAETLDLGMFLTFIQHYCNVWKKTLTSER